MSFDLSKIFSQNKQQQVVGVSLTPGIGLEAVLIDRAHNQIVNYGKRDVAYNFATREIADKIQFVNELSGLLKEDLKLPEKTPVYFVLPNILFDFMEYPPEINADGLSMMVLSKAEEFYLFKKEEPQSGWCELKNKGDASQKRIVYTSFQQSVIDELKEVVEENLKYTLAGVESAYSATLRGLYVSGRLEEVLLEESPWTLMLINGNSFTLFNMEVDNLISYHEVPLALKSFSMEEAYQAITSSASQLLLNFPASKLYIVSQTDEISAEVLQRELKFNKEIVAINSNRYTKEPVFINFSSENYERTKTLTLSVLGAAVPRSVNFHLTINVLQNVDDFSSGIYRIPLNGKVYEITSEQITKCALGIIFFVLIAAGLLCAGFSVLGMQAKNEADAIESKLAATKQELEGLSKVEEKKPEVDMSSVIDEVASMNVNAINYYDSIAADIPKNVWLTKYYNKGGDKIVVRGVAENISDIYEYFKNLKILVPQSNIKLVELKVVTANDGGEENKNGNEENNSEDILKDLNVNATTARLYSFEISNTEINRDFIKTDKEGEEKNKIDENNLLRSAPKKIIEETSKQMKEAK